MRQKDIAYKFSEWKQELECKCPEFRSRSWSHFFGTGAGAKKSDSDHFCFKVVRGEKTGPTTNGTRPEKVCEPLA